MPVSPLEKRAIAHRLDALPITSLHVLIIALCSAGFAFDLLEMALGSVLSAVFSATPQQRGSQELAWLLSSVYVGAVVGAPLLGWVADRHGRRKVLTGVLLWLGVSSFGAAISADITQLTLFRGVSGLALGAFPPLVIAYLTDLLPPARRGALIFVTIALAALGPAIGIFVIRWLTPMNLLGLEAWRWGFIIGGAGALLVGALSAVLPESPRWLESQGRLEQALAALGRFERSAPLWKSPTDVRPGNSLPAEAVPLANPEEGMAKHKKWALVGLLFLLSPWSTVAFPLLTGAVLTQKGFNLADTLLYVGLATFGPLVGSLLTAHTVDRIERRLALGLCAVFMAISGGCFVMVNTQAWLILSIVSFNVFSSLYVSVLNVYGAELFTTASRASSISAAWAMNRIGAVAAPLLLIPLLRSGGANTMFGAIGVALALSLVLLVVMPRGRQLRALI
ncbi:MFS transporter [Variovorax sp. HJSM1_2]|uniref:MFS transporter n=1 Tax=Variovorax sp. HJSM1_2 TaxID=3366263 RepID=UPI003BC3104A